MSRPDCSFSRLTTPTASSEISFTRGFGLSFMERKWSVGG
jgi:hypothetical protein